MKPTAFAAFVLLLFAWASAVSVAVSADESEALADQCLRETIERYFHSIQDYQQGDLICQSQVEELQLYLLRTHGRVPATHPRLLHRVLPDEAPLIKSFYLNGGANVLREAAERLHGYRALQALAHTVSGRTQISAAISSENLDLLVNAAKQNFSREQDSSFPEQDERQVHPAVNHIFTLEQFIEASLTPDNAENSSPARKKSTELPTTADDGSPLTEREN